MEQFLTIHPSQEWHKRSVTVTGVFISYNQRAFVGAGLASVLAQDYPMQVVVSDDYSQDGTLDVIRGILSTYDGNHDVTLRRAGRNLGVCANQNAAISQAQGELVVLFEGDDISDPTRVSTLVNYYERSGRGVGAIGSGVRKIDEHGEPIEEVIWPTLVGDSWCAAAGGWNVVGCTMAFRRDCFFEIGPITRHLLSGDIALWMRAAFLCNGGLLQVPIPLVQYRCHSNNVSKSRPISYDSATALRKFCEAWLMNEVARVEEWKKIGKYRERMLGEKLRSDKAFEFLGQSSRCRAALVYSVARRPRGHWIIPGLKALRFSVTRRLGLRVLTTALCPQALRLRQAFCRSSATHNAYGD